MTSRARGDILPAIVRAHNTQECPMSCRSIACRIAYAVKVNLKSTSCRNNLVASGIDGHPMKKNQQESPHQSNLLYITETLALARIQKFRRPSRLHLGRVQSPSSPSPAMAQQLSRQRLASTRIQFSSSSMPPCPWMLAGSFGNIMLKV